MTRSPSEKKLFFTILCVLFIPATVYSALFVPVMSILNNNVEYADSVWAIIWNQLTFLPDLVMRLGAAICLVAAARITFQGIWRLYVWCVGAAFFRLLSASIVGGFMEGSIDFSDFGYDCLIFAFAWAVECLYVAAVALFGKRNGNGWAIATAAVIFGVRIISALRYDLYVGMPTDGTEWFVVIIMYVSLIACGVLTILCLPHGLQKLMKRLIAPDDVKMNE